MYNTLPIVNKFEKYLKACRTKKDYKRVAKKMLKQIDAMECINFYVKEILFDIIGEDNYVELMSVAMQAYIAHNKGLEVHIAKVELDEFTDDLLK